LDSYLTDSCSDQRLFVEIARDEPYMSGIRRELPEGRVQGEPPFSVYLRPGVVVEKVISVHQAKGGPRRYPGRLRKSDIKCRMLVAVAPHGLQGADGYRRGDRGYTQEQISRPASILSLIVFEEGP
jgi:hypothetical protein